MRIFLIAIYQQWIIVNNRVIKDCHTLRRRLFLPAFFRAVEKMMQSYSGDSNDKPHVTTPDVPTEFLQVHMLCWGQKESLQTCHYDNEEDGPHPLSG
uniref:Uncharacterized protein n=1 Tax=Ditylenchus dipsaci TaxID=166011 RepID=A0A915CVW0_9BILA